MHSFPYDYSHTLLFQSTLNKTSNFDIQQIKATTDTHATLQLLKTTKNSHLLGSLLPNRIDSNQTIL